MSEHNETMAEIVADMRIKYPPAPRCVHTVTGQYVHDEMTWLADRIEAAVKRDADSIERLVRDAIIDYQEMFAHAPNDDAERELVERAERGNDWLVAHGYEPEKTIWDKEETPMSMNEHETHAAVVAEMRECEGYRAYYDGGLHHDSGEESVVDVYSLHDYAARAEAAHKREVDKLNSVIQATVSRSDAEIDRLRRERDTLQRERDELAKDYNNAQRERSTANSKLREMEKSVGNAVKLREALVKIREIVTADAPADEVEIANIAYLALAAPPRNCDRFDDLNSAQRHYIEHGCPRGLGMLVDGEIRKAPWKSQFEKWLFAPANEKGATDGSK